MRNILEYEDYRYLNENYDIIEDALHKDKELNDLKKKQDEIQHKLTTYNKSDPNEVMKSLTLFDELDEIIINIDNRTRTIFDDLRKKFKK